MQNLPVDFSPVRGKKVLVALSGGADSVALLALLREWGGCALAAAHLEHGIRGEQARADADFCRALCAKWQVEYLEARADVPEEARRLGLGLETAAREVRYEFLRRAKTQTCADVIALAHHMDDQAETLLMHLLRGAGVSGMRGMRVLSGDLYRPLLGVRKRDLTAYLEARGIPWREDATNAETDTPRNLLRQRALPVFEAAYPAAVPAMARHAALAAEEDDYLCLAAARWLEACREVGPYGVRLRYTEPPHPALLRRALRLAAGTELDFAQTEALCALAGQSSGALQLPRGLRAERCASGLYFLPERREAPEPVPLQIPGTTRLEGLCELRAEAWNGGPIRENGPRQTLDLAALNGAVLRTRRPGDRIRPFGMRGEKLLSDYLTDRKIDRPVRDTLPLVARGNAILWAVGVGIAAEAALRPGCPGLLLSAAPWERTSPFASE